MYEWHNDKEMNIDKIVNISMKMYLFVVLYFIIRIFYPYNFTYKTVKLILKFGKYWKYFKEVIFHITE